MTSQELLMQESRAQEIGMLREYTEHMGMLECGQVLMGAAAERPEDCQCFSCAARECLLVVEAMKRVVAH